MKIITTNVSIMFNTLGHWNADFVALWFSLCSTHHIPVFHNSSFIFLNPVHEKCSDEDPGNYVFHQEGRLSTRLWRIYRGVCAPVWATSCVEGRGADVSVTAFGRTPASEGFRTAGARVVAAGMSSPGGELGKRPRKPKNFPPGENWRDVCRGECEGARRDDLKCPAHPCRPHHPAPCLLHTEHMENYHSGLLAKCSQIKAE